MIHSRSVSILHKIHSALFFRLFFARLVIHHFCDCIHSIRGVFSFTHLISYKLFTGPAMNKIDEVLERNEVGREKGSMHKIA